MGRRLSVSIVALATIVSSCSGECEKMGCISGVSIRLPEDRLPNGGTITVCVEDECATMPVTHSPILVTVPGVSSSGPHETTIDVSAPRSGETSRLFSGQLDFVRHQPNGNGCSPVCYFAEYSGQ